MRGEYTAVVKQEGEWWIGWIEEVPGVNCQEATHEGLIESLQVTLREALELNREEAVPRHTEIHDLLAKKICKDLGVDPPG